MSQQTDVDLKKYFETGDTPTEAQFSDLIDSKQSRLTDWNFKIRDIVVPYTAVNGINATTTDYVLATLPVGEMLIGWDIHNTANWTGGTINSATAAMVVPTSAPQAFTSVSIFTGAGNNAGQLSMGFAIPATRPNFAASVAISVRITIGSLFGDQRLTNLTAGSMTIRLVTMVNPSLNPV